MQSWVKLQYRKEYEDLIEEGISDADAVKILLQADKEKRDELQKQKDDEYLVNHPTMAQHEDNILRKHGYDLGMKIIEARRKAYKSYNSFKIRNGLS